MVKNTNLNKAMRIRDDEFYTNPALVEGIMNRIPHKPSDIFIFPCDGESSEFVKYAKAHHLHYISCTEGFFFQNEIDMDRTDKYIVVTNPPFSKLKSFLGTDYYQHLLLDFKLRGAFIVPCVGICNKYATRIIFNRKVGFYMPVGSGYGTFNRPDGSVSSALNNCAIMSNMDLGSYVKPRANTGCNVGGDFDGNLVTPVTGLGRYYPFEILDKTYVDGKKMFKKIKGHKI